MKTIRSLVAMAAWSKRLQCEGVVIGMVPTMGALHAGHRALIRAARRLCDALVVSVFVNPTQFAATEDLATYPRPIQNDRVLCRDEGVDICFEPTASAMYPKGSQTLVTVPSIGRRWEGEFRPHHFTGVATVVAKLFGIVRPELALFGQKDYQQSALVQQLVKDLHLGTRIVVRPTVRERDGLAMSSRNVFLSTAERRVAPIFFHALEAGRQAIEAGLTDAESVQAMMRNVIAGEPTIRIDYLAVVEPRTLEPLATIDRQAVIIGAIRLGSVRLIDNVIARGTRRRS
jgi:pantoate--beta-alanine ligase